MEQIYKKCQYQDVDPIEFDGELHVFCVHYDALVEYFKCTKYTCESHRAPSDI